MTTRIRNATNAGDVAEFTLKAVAATVILLGSAYTFGTREIPAPQATLMKTIIEGVLSGALPWGLVLSGGGLAVANRNARQPRRTCR